MKYFPPPGYIKSKFTTMPVVRPNLMGSGFSYSSFNQQGGMFGPGNPFEFNFPLMPIPQKIAFNGGRKKRKTRRKGRK